MPVRLFHVSDLHFGTDDPDALGWFAQAVVDERPDAVIVTGDLTAAGRPHEFAAAFGYLRDLRTPVTIEIGNHDMAVGNLWERFVHPYRRYDKLKLALERPVALAGVTIVALRTATRAQLRLNWAEGVVRPQRLADTVAALAEAPAGNWKIVACHHPLVGSGQRFGTRNGEIALAQLAAHGANAVVSGHTHEPFDTVWSSHGRSVRLVGAGTLSERLRESRPSFNVLTVDAGSMQVDARFMRQRVGARSSRT